MDPSILEPQKICKIMAFMAIILGLGLLFYTRNPKPYTLKPLFQEYSQFTRGSHLRQGGDVGLGWEAGFYLGFMGVIFGLYLGYIGVL